MQRAPDSFAAAPPASCPGVKELHNTNLHSVALNSHNALDEDIIIQAGKGLDALEGGIVKDGAQHWNVGALVRLPKDAPVWVEDDDISRYWFPSTGREIGYSNSDGLRLSDNTRGKKEGNTIFQD